MNDREMPIELQILIGWLGHQRFVVTESTESESFGDRLTTLVRDALRIRILRDRGQWAIVASGGLVSGWFDVDVWQALIEERDPPRTPRQLSEQARALRRILPMLTPDILNDADTLKILRRKNWSRLGLGGRPPQ